MATGNAASRRRFPGLMSAGALGYSRPSLRDSSGPSDPPFSSSGSARERPNAGPASLQTSAEIFSQSTPILRAA